MRTTLDRDNQGVILERSPADPWKKSGGHLQTITATDLGQLERVFRSDFERSHFIFRGVTDALHRLRPGVGREIDGHQPYKERRERGLLDRFKQHAALHLTAPPTNEWDWLALAQHHGVPTRLLDWSFNPLVATWFALKGRYSSIKPYKRKEQSPAIKRPAAIYVRRIPPWVDTRSALDPFLVSEVVSFLPTHVSRRITVQSGLFTVHPNPSQDWDDDLTTAILLEFDEHEWRKATRFLLRFGIHQYALFPELDGLAAHLAMLYVRGFDLTYGKRADLDQEQAEAE